MLIAYLVETKRGNKTELTALILQYDSHPPKPRMTIPILNPVMIVD